MKGIQEQMAGNNCYGCGPSNPDGMRIKSIREGNETVCRYMPKPSQCAGPPQFVYGGTIASLIDCHSVGTAVGNYYATEKREISSEPEIWCVTGRLTVNYRLPTPIDQEIELRATVTEFDEKKSTVECRVYSGGTQVADGEVIAIRVPPEWREG